MLWHKEESLFKSIFGKIDITERTLMACEKGYRVLVNSAEGFFIKNLVVPPNRFRPENKLGN